MSGGRKDAARRRGRGSATKLALALPALAITAAVVPGSGPREAATQPVRAARSLPGLLTGFTDEPTFQRGEAKRQAALARVKAARGTVIRLTFNWADIAPREPPSPALARDPQWSGYDWRAPDRIVSDVAGAGLVPLFSVTKAPAWAEGPGRPRVSARVPSGSWRPSPVAFGDFAQALAARYSGRIPDPAHPDRMLPRVTYFQAWNEPNLSNFLTPQ